MDNTDKLPPPLSRELFERIPSLIGGIEIDLDAQLIPHVPTSCETPLLLLWGLPAFRIVWAYFSLTPPAGAAGTGRRSVGRPAGWHCYAILLGHLL